jgi:hypothetical protein
MELHFLHFFDINLSRNLTFLALTTTELVAYYFTSSYFKGIPSSSTYAMFVLTRFIIDSNVFLSSSFTIGCLITGPLLLNSIAQISSIMISKYRFAYLSNQD